MDLTVEGEVVQLSIARESQSSSSSIAPAPFDDDTNVNDWAGAEDFEVVEEEELVAMTDDVLGAVGTDWPHDDETNVGNETTRRK
jgi:hypothetical protein